MFLKCGNKISILEKIIRKYNQSDDTLKIHNTIFELHHFILCLFKIYGYKNFFKTEPDLLGM